MNTVQHRPAGTPSAAAAASAVSPAVVIDHRELPAAHLPGLEHRTLAGSEHGLHDLSIWQQTLEPGAATPPHRHDTEEVVLCHAGWGELQLAGTLHRFGPNSSVLVPRNAPHQIFNVGAEPMHIIGVLATAPVQVFGTDGLPIELPW
jgi:quercetin dioxygenase-like cupin family protein